MNLTLVIGGWFLLAIGVLGFGWGCYRVGVRHGALGLARRLMRPAQFITDIDTRSRFLGMLNNEQDKAN